MSIADSSSSVNRFTPTTALWSASTSAWKRDALDAICRWNQPDSIPATTPPCASISAKSPSASRSSLSVNASMK